MSAASDGVKAWLGQTLAAGPRQSGEVKTLATQAGIGPKALRNARESLGVVATRHGNGASMRSTWALPVEVPTALGSPESPVSVDQATIGALAEPSFVPPPRRWRTTLRNPKVRGASAAPAGGPALDENERRRTERRVELFVERGLDEHDARRVAIALVERDRTAGQAVGSCIECQSFVRKQCPEPQAPALIHECWSRRHDAP